MDVTTLRMTREPKHWEGYQQNGMRVGNRTHAKILIIAGVKKESSKGKSYKKVRFNIKI